MVKITNNKDHWLLAVRLLFISASIRVDLESYPGVSFTFGLFRYHIGLSMLKYEPEIATAN